MIITNLSTRENDKAIIPRPVCRHHTDCFAVDEKGKCSCLIDTDFGGKDCPFYKRDRNEIRGRDYV